MQISRRTISDRWLGLASPPRQYWAKTDARIHVVKGSRLSLLQCLDRPPSRERFQCKLRGAQHRRTRRVQSANVASPMNLSLPHGDGRDYTIEGHVPAADIRRLWTNVLTATGLTVPGMPFGSPGMGPETEREAYQVLLVD